MSRKAAKTVNSVKKKMAQQGKKRSRKKEIFSVKKIRRKNGLRSPNGMSPIDTSLGEESFKPNKGKNGGMNVSIKYLAGGIGVQKTYCKINDKEHCGRVVRIMRTVRAFFLSKKFPGGVKVTVPVVRLFDDDFILMDKAEGIRMDSIRLTKYDRLCANKALRAAMSFLNTSQNQIYHNDLHPRNLFWCRDTKTLTIIDWDEATESYRNSKSNYWVEFTN
jgi:thiamine kinase-like enzyme